MNAPDRSEEVKLLCLNNPAVFQAADRDVSRRRFLPVVCNMLNGLDRTAGQLEPWGVLVKRDRVPPFIPSDVVVWRDTGEHFDAMTDEGGVWIAEGPIAEQSHRWEWASARAVASDGSSVPRIVPIEPPPPLEEDDQAAFLLTLLEPLGRIVEGLDELTASTRALDDRLAAIQRDGVRFRLR